MLLEILMNEFKIILCVYKICHLWVRTCNLRSHLCKYGKKIYGHHLFFVLSVIMRKDGLLKGKDCNMNCQNMMTS